MRSLYSKLDIARGPETPSGVYVRVVEGRTLYVNTTEIEKAIAIQGKKRGALSGQTCDTVLRLKPMTQICWNSAALHLTDLTPSRAQDILICVADCRKISGHSYPVTVRGTEAK
jgi:hypothetical protein